MVTLGDSRSAEGRSSVTGDLLVLCSSLFYGCYTIAIRRCVAVCCLGPVLLQYGPPSVCCVPSTGVCFLHGGCAATSEGPPGLTLGPCPHVHMEEQGLFTVV